MSFNISQLPRDYPRRFLASDLDASNRESLEEVFYRLQKRDISSKDALEAWLRDESEFYSAILEEKNIRYIRMTCQTDDPKREREYLYFIEEVEPQVKIRQFALHRKYLESPARKHLPQDRFMVLDRKRDNKVAIFREENVELEKEETKLDQKYEKTAGAMTVVYDGQERTMQQMAKYLEEPKRHVRQETWQLSQERRLKDRDTIDEIYDELIQLRDKIARNAGFENYRDFGFRKRERFDYTPEDCFRFHQGVEEHIVPLARSLDRDRHNDLAVKPLRPWDLAVDPKGRPPLKPFTSASELVNGCARIFDRMHSEFGRGFRRMTDLNLLDLESRKGKAPGGYQQDLPEVRLPFIFMNAVGRDIDLRTLLHESGHAFHAFAVRDKDFHFFYRDEVPTEFAEVASMTMDLMAGEHLEGDFYNHEDALRSRSEHLKGIVRLLPWIATIDAFQHWVYTNPGHSREEREEFWLKLQKRFGGIEDWTGFEHVLRSFWQRQLHLFGYPLYYIEYGIAQLGALGIWTRYLKDAQSAIEAYRRALALGGSRPLPELFEAAEVPFDFGPKTLASYARALEEAIKAN